MLLLPCKAINYKLILPLGVCYVKSAAGMASLPHGNMNCSILCKREAFSFVGFAALPFLQPRAKAFDGLVRGQSMVSLLYFNFCSFFVL
jgi:hypothetical protein